MKSATEIDTNLNAMFKAVKLPAGVSDLDTSLTDVDRDALPHFRFSEKNRSVENKIREEEEETEGRV